MSETYQQFALLNKADGELIAFFDNQASAEEELEDAKRQPADDEEAQFLAGVYIAERTVTTSYSGWTEVSGEPAVPVPDAEPPSLTRKRRGQ